MPTVTLFSRACVRKRKPKRGHARFAVVNNDPPMFLAASTPQKPLTSRCDRQRRSIRVATSLYLVKIVLPAYRSSETRKVLPCTNVLCQRMCKMSFVRCFNLLIINYHDRIKSKKKKITINHVMSSVKEIAFTQVL